MASQFGDGGIAGRGKPATGPYPLWVVELMAESGVRSLPRTPDELGRALDGTDFWQTFGVAPVRGRAD